jgi:hypothetical protein
MNNEENEEIKPPKILDDWLAVCKATLAKNSSATKQADALDPLVWRSFTQEFTIDPKSLSEMLTLVKTGTGKKSTPVRPLRFQRELSPESVHWHGTKVHFLHHNLLTSLLPPGKEVRGLVVPATCHACMF